MKNLRLVVILTVSIFWFSASYSWSQNEEARTPREAGWEIVVEEQGFDWQIEESPGIDWPTPSNKPPESSTSTQSGSEDEKEDDRKVNQLREIAQAAINQAEIEVVKARIAADSARLYFGRWLVEPRKNDNNPQVKRIIAYSNVKTKLRESSG